MALPNLKMTQIGHVVFSSCKLSVRIRIWPNTGSENLTVCIIHDVCDAGGGDTAGDDE